MTQQIEFSRNINRMHVSVDNQGLWVTAGWTVGIPRATAIDYVRAYNTSPAKGFYEHEGSVVLSHGAGKITLSQQESHAILDVIRAAYGPF